MPDLLKTIEKKGKRTKPRRTLLYGTHGIGKSSFAACAPKPIFLDLEDGLETIEVHATPKIETLEEFLEWIGELYESDHKFETLVVDTLDFLERKVWEKVCRDGNKKTIDDFGFGKGYKSALKEWVEILEAFDALRNTRNMSILLLAHSHTEKYENPETEPYDRYAPRLHKTASQVVQQWCDEVLFAFQKVYTVEGKESFGKKQTRALSSDERILRCEERASSLAKNRLGMPVEIPLDWDAYAEHLKPKAKS